MEAKNVVSCSLEMLWKKMVLWSPPTQLFDPPLPPSLTFTFSIVSHFPAEDLNLAYTFIGGK